MILLRWKGQKLKLGPLTLFNTRSVRGWFIYYICHIPIWKKKNSLSSLMEDFRTSKKFDTREFDKRILELAPRIELQKVPVTPDRVAFLATELYDMGGHSKCLLEAAALLDSDYSEALFLTKPEATLANAPDTIKRIEKYSYVGGCSLRFATWKKDVLSLFQQIFEYNPKVLFVFIHSDDVFGAMVVAMIRAYTNTKIFFSNHASHFPSLGISFADIILEGMPTTAYVTQNFRKCKKTHICGMASKRLEDFIEYDADTILKYRKELGVSEDEFCTMSGGAAYKFFDSEEASEYFCTVKKLLERNTNIKHVILSDFNQQQKDFIHNFFSDGVWSKRLVILPTCSNYELAFSCADVFIDSFPVSSALTMIDLMRLKVPAVVKINRKNALLSFHEYQRVDYPYMFETAEGVLEGVERLLDDSAERDRVARDNYYYYLERYEGNAHKKHLIELIEHADHLDPYYDILAPDLTYEFHGVTL